MSAVELTRTALDKLDGEGRTLNAVAELTPERAMREAAAADARLAAGRPLSILDGIPYGAKDLLDTAGIPTRWGTPACADRVPHEDAASIKQLADAGAVLVGKLSLIQLCGAGGYRSPAASSTGACANPWDTSRWTGGSSSGSAACVAASLVPFALGSDSTGSIVAPAAWCGITGFRPTFGIVSLDGACPVSWSMDTIGPLARSAADCSAVMEVLWAARIQNGQIGEMRPLRDGLRRLRIGVLPTDFRDVPATKQAFEAALDVMRDAGSIVGDITLPPFDFADAMPLIMNTEAAVGLQWLIEGPSADKLLDTGQREGLAKALSRPIIEYQTAVEAREEFRTALVAVFDQVDLLVAPTRLHEAPPIDADIDKWPRGYSRIASAAGLPSVSIPMGFGPDGLPLGLWMAGRQLDDFNLLAASDAFQQLTDWHTRRPQATQLLPNARVPLT